jgi:hypothetical protein
MKAHPPKHGFRRITAVFAGLLTIVALIVVPLPCAWVAGKLHGWRAVA